MSVYIGKADVVAAVQQTHNDQDGDMSYSSLARLQFDNPQSHSQARRSNTAPWPSIEETLGVKLRPQEVGNELSPFDIAGPPSPPSPPPPPATPPPPSPPTPPPPPTPSPPPPPSPSYPPPEPSTPPPPHASSTIDLPNVTGDPGVTLLLERYEELLDRIETHQEGLRDLRDHVLGARIRLKAKRQKLHTKIQQSIGHIGAAHDAMKRHLISSGLEIPPEINAMWTNVDDIRNKLSEEEHYYHEAEQQYNEEEWQYNKFEAKFIEDLAATPALRDTQIGIVQRIRGNTADSGEFETSIPARSIANTIPDLVTPLPTQKSADPGRMIDNLRQKYGEFFAKSVNPHDTCHTPELVDLRIGLSPETRPISWPETHGFIHDWLLHIVENSPLHQSYLRHVVPQGTLTKHDWLQRIRHQWREDRMHVPDFHTGDTTVASASSRISQPLDDDEGQLHMMDATVFTYQASCAPSAHTAASSMTLESMSQGSADWKGDPHTLRSALSNPNSTHSEVLSRTSFNEDFSLPQAKPEIEPVQSSPTEQDFPKTEFLTLFPKDEFASNQNTGTDLAVKNTPPAAATNVTPPDEP